MFKLLSGSRSEFSFPNDSEMPLHFYPDITPQMQDLKQKMYQTIGQERAWRNDEDMAKFFQKNFVPKGNWDVIDKRKPQFPGIDDFGQMEYARYKNRVVDGPFLNHHLYIFLVE